MEPRSSSDVARVAIDGPSASGKSTVARHVAQQLGFVYVDSGSLYRGVTWMTLERGVPADDTAGVTDLLSRLRVDAHVRDGAVVFTLDGEDPGPALRSQAVVERVSDVAAIPEVRRFVVARLRETVRFGSLVMEGRDIGSVVFPDSSRKYYLDADPEERARRRHQELARDDSTGGLDDVRDALKRRDRKDTTRETAPLQIAPGARVINTTCLSIEEVAAAIVRDARGAGF